jgi:hypothetical protein
MHAAGAVHPFPL